jgi:hypothetical protein
MTINQSYQTYVPQPEDVDIPPAQRDGNVSHRVAFVDGQMTEIVESRHTQGNSGQINPHYGTDTWEATARTPEGRAVEEITDTTLVTIGGLQAPVSFFVKEGNLQKLPDGTFAEGTGESKEGPKETNDDVFRVNDEAMSVINDALDPLPEHALAGFTAQGIGAALGRFDEASMVKKFADGSGLELADSQQRVDAIKAMYQGHADYALEHRFGIGAADRAEFWAWAKAEHGSQLQDAIGKQLHGHDVSGYRALAEKWKSSTAPSVASLKAAGIPTRVGGLGQECYVAGKWMSPATAARAGLI